MFIEKLMELLYNKIHPNLHHLRRSNCDMLKIHRHRFTANYWEVVSISSKRKWFLSIAGNIIRFSTCYLKHTHPMKAKVWSQSQNTRGGAGLDLKLCPTVLERQQFWKIAPRTGCIIMALVRQDRSIIRKTITYIIARTGVISCRTGKFSISLVWRDRWPWKLRSSPVGVTEALFVNFSTSIRCRKYLAGATAVELWQYLKHKHDLQ